MNNEFNGLGDLYISIGNLIKQYEEDMHIKSMKDDIKQLYSINEVTKLYPKLTKYLLTKAINDGLLPVVWIGNERHFYANDIENYLNKNNHKNIHTLNSWRTNEQS